MTTHRVVSMVIGLVLVVACGGATPTSPTLDSRCQEFDPNMDPGVCQIYLDRDSRDGSPGTTAYSSGDGYHDDFGARPYDDYSRYDGVDQEDPRTLDDE